MPTRPGPPQGYPMLDALGRYGWLLAQAAVHARHAWTDRRRLVLAFDQVGLQAFGIVLVTGFFAGSLIAWQAAYQFRGLAPLSLLGGQAAKVIVMEVGPVLTALVMCGRMGASMAAEIGSMRTTEQIDALRSLGIDPVRYLVMPRLVALALLLPVLTVFSDATALLGAFVVTRFFQGISTEVFLDSVRQFLVIGDAMGGLFKAAVFGVLISSIGCWFGLSAEGGAEGVGQATVRAFVGSALAVLAADYALWTLLF